MIRTVPNRLLSVFRLCALAIVLVAGLAHARPGGGGSFSGGGGHSTGGFHSTSSSSSSGGFHSSGTSTGGFHTSSTSYGSSSDGGGAALFLIFFLVILVVVMIAIARRRAGRNRDWDSGPPSVERAITLTFTDLPKLDPQFSQVVFEDFVYRLFAAAQRVRHSDDALLAVAPYVSEPARRALAMREPAGVVFEQVIVGAMRTFHVDIPSAPSGRIRIGVEFETNLESTAHTYYTVERWTFGRDASVHSKPPGRDRTFLCPNCGAPWEAKRTGGQQCGSCGEIVDNGRFDWVVEQIHVVSSTEFPPSLTAAVEERGTDLPTYRDPALDDSWQALTQDDPAINSAAIHDRLAMIYATLNTAWMNNDLGPIRGMVSDGLFDYLQYWVDAYQKQGLRNMLVDMRITNEEPAKLTRDPYFDALTIRIWGAGKDFVVRAKNGEHVHGSRSHDRAYSEYWTLIRSASRKGQVHTTPTCGNCGAPLQITQAGECEHCGAHVTAGEFDWVLSKIEQDDTYRG
jgi:hypothetical protein